MTRLMQDSVNPDAISPDAELVPYYATGPYAWSPEQLARFPNARHIAITVNTSDVGDVADVENGDLTPAMLPAWVVQRRAAGAIPVGYCSLDAWSECKVRCLDAGVAEPLWWVAHYDGVAELLAGAIAKQYANSAIDGGDYDLSIVADYWPGIDLAPAPSVDPNTEENIMGLVVISAIDAAGNNDGSYLVDTTSGAAGAITHDDAPQLPHVTMTPDAYNVFVAEAQKAAGTGA